MLVLCADIKRQEVEGAGGVVFYVQSTRERETETER